MPAKEDNDVGWKTGRFFIIGFIAYQYQLIFRLVGGEDRPAGRACKGRRPLPEKRLITFSNSSQHILL
jgi:hypothetical protein